MGRLCQFRGRPRAYIFPDGIVMAANGTRPPHQESLELVQRDFEGNLIWRFDRTEQITTSDGKSIWSARQHHDWQREDFPAGYYSPEFKPSIEGSSTLILTHTNRARPNVASAELEDDRLIEVSPKGEILWEWVASDHIDELGFSADARSAIKAAPGVNNTRASFDWLHINSATYLGPNYWFDEGDKRFAPNNVIRATACRMTGFRSSKNPKTSPSCRRPSATSGYGRIEGLV
jgi:hypothetical protein